eukprot:scaffold21511_cov133-Isochrysis_galbana.AAC.3
MLVALAVTGRHGVTHHLMRNWTKEGRRYGLGGTGHRGAGIAGRPAGGRRADRRAGRATRRHRYRLGDLTVRR